ncbi:mitogen-activated protein kinase kinase kinase 19 isoform X2 [Ambystoma mexicanum]|uniref:mitogen-activated protein kinase kinase kinase 19 isoform X2 n=1 Tax=Ambystoma mexicanum TaxID=8296 RepID=UPI0037E825AF
MLEQEHHANLGKMEPTVTGHGYNRDLKSARKSHSELSSSYEDHTMTSLPRLWQSEPSVPEFRKIRHTSLPPIYTEKDKDGKPPPIFGFGFLAQGSRSEPNISKAYMGVDTSHDLNKQNEKRSKRAGIMTIKKSEYFLPVQPAPSRSNRMPLWEDSNMHTKHDFHIKMNPPNVPNKLVNKYLPLPSLSASTDKEENMLWMNTPEQSLSNVSEASWTARSITPLPMDPQYEQEGVLICNEDVFDAVDGKDHLLKPIENIDNAETLIIRGAIHFKPNQIEENSLGDKVVKRTLKVPSVISSEIDGVISPNIVLNNAILHDINMGTTTTAKENEDLVQRNEMLETNIHSLEDNLKGTVYTDGTMYSSDGKPLEIMLRFVESTTNENNVTQIEEAVQNPTVHITLSEHEPFGENHLKASKKGLARSSSISCSVPAHSNNSSNLLAEKESSKRKKVKKRTVKSPTTKTKTSAKNSHENVNWKLSSTKQDLKAQAISKHVSIKGLGLLSPVFVQTMISSKSKKKGQQTLAIKSANKSMQEASALESKNVVISTTPVHRSMLGSQQATHFNNLKYSDMFVNIKSSSGGPEICEMFGSPVYAYAHEVPHNEDKSHLPVISSPQRKIFSSQSSRPEVTKVNKRIKSTQKRAKSSTKSNKPGVKENPKSGIPKPKPFLSAECDNENHNEIIISGPNWQITPSHSGAYCQTDDVGDSMSECSQSVNHHKTNLHSQLPTIQESTLENMSFNRYTPVQNQISSERKISGPLSHETIDNNSKIKELSNQEHTHLSFPQNGQDKQPSPESAPEVEFDSHSHMEAYERLTSLKRNNEIIELLEGDNEESLSNKAEKYDSARLSTQSKEQILNSVNSISQTYREIVKHASCEELTDKLLSSLAEQMLSIDGNNFSLLRTITENIVTERQSDFIKHFKDATNIEETEESCGTEGNMGSLSDELTLSKYSSINDDSVMWTKGDVLGKGAYGTVYCGLTSHGQLIAAKQVALDTTDQAITEKEYQKLQEEVDLLRTLKHANIVGFLGTCLQDNVVSIFMEFVPGGSISSILKRFGPLPEIVFCKYTKQILQGVSYLHENKVIHRDIKGNNIMLMQTGVIKLIDFGCAKRLACLSLTGTKIEMLKSVHGTPYWMAPEVINSSGYGTKSDIWSVGCTVFEMATGKPPLAHMDRLPAMFYIGAQRGQMPSLPSHFSENAREFVDSCLNRDQNERPSASQLLQHPFIWPKRRMNSWTTFHQPK